MTNPALSPKYASDFGLEKARLMLEYLDLVEKAQNQFWAQYPFIEKVYHEKELQLKYKNFPSGGYEVVDLGFRLQCSNTHLEQQAVLLHQILEGYSRNGICKLLQKEWFKIDFGSVVTDREVVMVIDNPDSPSYLQVCSIFLQNLKPQILRDNWPALSQLFTRPVISEHEDSSVICRPAYVEANCV